MFSKTICESLAVILQYSECICDYMTLLSCGLHSCRYARQRAHVDESPVVRIFLQKENLLKKATRMLYWVYFDLSEEVTFKRHLKDMEDNPVQDSQGEAAACA